MLGDFLDRCRLLEHTLSLLNDLRADWRDRNFRRAPLKQLNAQLIFQLSDGYRQRGLADEARFGRTPEMPLARHGNNVLEFGKRHDALMIPSGVTRFMPSETPGAVPASG